VGFGSDLEAHSRLENVVVAFLLALAIVLGLYELLYGSWAVAWNLRQSPPSYGGAGVCTLIALATPLGAVATWRRGRQKGHPSHHIFSATAAIAASVATVVATFLAIAAAFTGT